MAKKAADMPAEGILNWVQKCKFGGHAQHTAAPYDFIDGTGAFPHSGLLFNCVTGEGKGRRAASGHSNWRPIHDGHPDFVVLRDAQTWMGSRMATGAAALEYREDARKAEWADKRQMAAAQKRQDASETAGAIAWECAEGGGNVVRGLAPGKRLTFSHLEAMGQYRAEWLQEVARNNMELGWTV